MIYKHSSLQRLPYRQLYPNAPISEWKLKGNDKENNMRVIQLIDPNINIEELWVKEEEEEEFDGDAGQLMIVPQARTVLREKLLFANCRLVIGTL